MVGLIIVNARTSFHASVKDFRIDSPIWTTATGFAGIKVTIVRLIGFLASSMTAVTSTGFHGFFAGICEDQLIILTTILYFYLYLCNFQPLFPVNFLLYISELYKDPLWEFSHQTTDNIVKEIWIFCKSWRSYRIWSVFVETRTLCDLNTFPIVIYHSLGALTARSTRSAVHLTFIIWQRVTCLLARAIHMDHWRGTH